ncbi:MAG: DUF4258 domain-containing protein [Anaerolineae bacterium]|nr:DUF4258 domain-containing protein [Anaerolineae bacterium]
MNKKPVRFTKHARQKFDDLAEMGFSVSEAQVVDAVRNPAKVDRGVYPPIAQKPVSKNHLLRVAFVEDEQSILIVTFYPGRISRYES